MVQGCSSYGNNPYQTGYQSYQRYDQKGYGGQQGQQVQYGGGPKGPHGPGRHHGKHHQPDQQQNGMQFPQICGPNGQPQLPPGCGSQFSASA